jgi:5-methylcytosine-specific restriction endonuclease McrA
MEAIARLDYFRLPNLVTLCHECHRHKTKKEAAERAHHNALAKRHDGTERPKRKTKWPSRKIQSRGFPKAQERK